MQLSAISFLESDFPYYNQLSPKGKRKFLRRLKRILNTKDFIGRDGLVITHYIRYYIASAWVALTYGLKEYITQEYTQVHVFPDTFYSEQVQAYVKGLTTGKGIIFLSWHDFVEDYKVANNLNVGLHELTHAILISAAFKSNFDDHFSDYYRKFFANTKDDFIDLQLGNPSYLRKYGGANMVEFLSVCVECFFERPAELKEKMPVLYYNLCILFIQNPVNTLNDYKVDDVIVYEIRSSYLDHGIPDEVLDTFANPTTTKIIQKILPVVIFVSLIIFFATMNPIFLMPVFAGLFFMFFHAKQYEDWG
ncbi:MAG: zinc-dependent peptidase [Sphingobacteriales bacterium JAD_PAG50586_3]|nr:MAG: zinc-dependent peptidase [Sphingobacteriales bacterium JAD_PAG50586_3]